MSVGNLGGSVDKGRNMPFQLKVLQGLQRFVDNSDALEGFLASIDGNTDGIEPLLTQILAALQASRDYEAALVVDATDTTWLEVRIMDSDTGTFSAPVYYAVGSNVAGTPTLPIVYINPNTYLASIVTNTGSTVTNTASIVANTATLVADLITIVARLTTIQTNTTGVARVPHLLRPAAAGNIAVPVFDISISNVGVANGVVLGGTIKPGETLTFDARANNFYPGGSFTYDASGTEFVIVFNT